jgi:hypothetical protein
MNTSLLRKANAKPVNDIPGPILDTYDAQYKTRIWDVSQNIDCFVYNAQFVICVY